MPPHQYSSKKEALEALERETTEDTSLSLQEANLVFGKGNPDAEVIFIGEAPGYYENRERRPFVGRSGQLLTELLKTIGWKRENVYITNIVKRRPPENRDPTPEEITLYTPYLLRQIEIIRPKVILPLGRFSMNFFLPTAKISRDQGKMFWWKESLVVPLYHPAAALRSMSVKAELEKSFSTLPTLREKYAELLKERGAITMPSEKEEVEKSQPGLF